MARSVASWRARRSCSTTGHARRPPPAVEAEHLDRLAGQCLADAVSEEVMHGPHPAHWAPATSASPTSSVPRLTRMVTTGATAGIKL